MLCAFSVRGYCCVLGPRLPLGRTLERLTIESGATSRVGEIKPSSKVESVVIFHYLPTRSVTTGTFGSRPRPNNRDLTKLRRRRQGERQKSDKKTTAHVHHAFFYVSLLSLHNYDVKWSNFNFTWERERQGDLFYYLCPNSGAVPYLQLQPKFPSFK